jgi:hypothetical protein
MSASPKKPAQNTQDYERSFGESAPQTSNTEATLPVRNSLRRAASQEPYVDAQRVAEHLSLTRREVLKLTRAAKLPAHAIDPTATRKIYRYRLSEIDDMLSRTPTAEEALGFTIPSRHNEHRQPQDRRG